MALETFLINPVGRKAKRKKSGARKRKGGLPSGLLSRMIRTYGPKKGMKEAWKEYRSGKRNPELPPVYHRKAVKVHRPTVYSGIRSGAWVRSPYSRSPRINPFGEEVMIVGNPRKRKHAKKRKPRRNEPDPGRRYYAKSRGRSSRKRSRRNPARSTGLAISPRRPMSLLMPVMVGTGGFFAADYLPATLGMSASPLTRIGIKAAVAIGGGMLLSRFLGAKNAVAFSFGVGINILNDVLRTYVLGSSAVTGLGAFTRRSQLGAFTRPILRPPRRARMGAINPYSSVSSPYAS